ncbi:CCA tRNA nucleotidyltransferase [Pilibacter termitis]|nr:CCA tRNA nucleotidyltransferase [Pilibacter termitis]
MKFKQIPKEFMRALPVIKKIENAGFLAYFVGGSVRDALLGVEIHDVDIATSAYPEEIKQIFPKTIDVGIEHGTVLVLCEEENYEITTFRTEGTYQDYRRPDEVTFVRTLEEDLRRRDFTINALALEQTGELVDNFEGEKDLENRVIRAVGVPKERFHEDALRMMRAFRFASQLDFEIEKETLLAIEENVFLLEKISVERILAEFVKMMMSKHWKRGLRYFLETNAFLYVPALSESSREALEQFLTLEENSLQSEGQMWALLLFMLEKESDEVRRFLKKWKESNQVIKETSNILQGLRHRKNQEWSALTLYSLSEEEASFVEELLGFFSLPYDVAKSREMHKQLPIHSKADLAVTGADLLQLTEMRQGKWLGKLLDELEKNVLLGEIDNKKQELLNFSQKKLEFLS